MANKGMPPSIQVGDTTYFTFAEVARRAEVSGDTVRNWVKKGTIGTYRIKGRQMISEPALTKFLTPQPVDGAELISVIDRKS